MKQRPGGSSSPVRWAAPIVALHWVIAALIFAVVAIGWAMTHAPLSATATFGLFQYHKSIGILVLGATTLRILVRATSHAPSSAAASNFERATARSVHAGLYVLTIAGALSGWLTASAAVIAIPTSFFGFFTIPPVSTPNQEIFDRASYAHGMLAYGLLALVALHGAGALKHHFLDRDDVFSRILPARPWAKGRDGIARRRGPLE